MPSQSDIKLARLEELFASLPGIGPRSASRIVTELMGGRIDLARELAALLSQTAASVHHCPCCHTLTTEPICEICADSTRDASVICVVESPADRAAIESSVAFSGRYFVLLGRVNPLMDVGPRELGADLLIARLKSEPVREVVIATSYTAEGETTAHVLIQAIRKHAPHVRVTRLARGLPAGVEVEYTDAATLAAAVVDRH